MYMQWKPTGNFIHKIKSYLYVLSRSKLVNLLTKENNVYVYVVEVNW